MENNIINLAEVRQARELAKEAAGTDLIAWAQERDRNEAVARLGPDWATDIHKCCAYARWVRADHDAESESIRFEAVLRDSCWSEQPDLRARVDANNLEWQRYIALLRYIAAIPATTRREASDKRHTIGKMWLGSSDSRLFGEMRSGCLADDHLFPPSEKLANRKAKARVS